MYVGISTSAVVNGITTPVCDKTQEDSMNREIKIFENVDFGSVRVVMRGDSPWFVARDVCACLGLGNASQTVSLLDEDEKGIISIDTLGGKQEVLGVSEPGLYSIMSNCRKPEAHPFKRWVTHEVLPSIRKDGFYIAGVQVPKFDNPAAIARAWADMYEAKLEADRQAQLALEQRDYAIATKNHIVAGRDQRLMQQRHEDIRALNRKDERNGRLEAMYAERGIELGAERSRADKAEDALGKGKTYSCAKNIFWLRDYFDFKHRAPKTVYQQIGRQLRRLSEEMGCEFIIVEDLEFNPKAYHADVIAEFRRRLDADPDYMKQYRK